METLKSFLKTELGCTILESVSPTPVKFDLALVEKINDGQKNPGPIREENFVLDMGEHTECEIRRYARYYYSQLGCATKYIGPERKDGNDTYVRMGEWGGCHSNSNKINGQ